jgi:hypothetical protein
MHLILAKVIHMRENEVEINNILPYPNSSN